MRCSPRGRGGHRVLRRGCVNKIGFARDSADQLAELRRGQEDERRQIQRAFEAVLGNGTSAGDQLSAALAAVIGVELRRNTPAELRRRAGNRGDDLVQRFLEWAELPVV